MNLPNGFNKVLRLLTQAQRPQARTGTPSVRAHEVEELQVSAHNHYQSIIENSLVKSETYQSAPTQSAAGSASKVQSHGSDHDHWFDCRSQNKNYKASDSNYRLQAFLQPGKVKELRSLDKNYNKRQGP